MICFRHLLCIGHAKQPHSLAELQVDLPHAADVKLHDQHQHDPHRKQIAFAEHQPHKRVKQRRQSRRDVAVKQEHEKIELFIDFIDVFAVFRRAQIADASGKRGIHLAEQIIQAFQHKPIVGIYTHPKSYHNFTHSARKDNHSGRENAFFPFPSSFGWPIQKSRNWRASVPAWIHPFSVL